MLIENNNYLGKDVTPKKKKAHKLRESSSNRLASASTNTGIRATQSAASYSRSSEQKLSKAGSRKVNF